MSTRPLLVMSPTSVGLRPPRPAPRAAVACGGSVGGATGLDGSTAPPRAKSAASGTSTAGSGADDRLPAMVRSDDLETASNIVSLPRWSAGGLMHAPYPVGVRAPIISLEAP